MFKYIKPVYRIPASKQRVYSIWINYMSWLRKFVVNRHHRLLKGVGIDSASHVWYVQLDFRHSVCHLPLTTYCQVFPQCCHLAAYWNRLPIWWETIVFFIYWMYNQFLSVIIISLTIPGYQLLLPSCHWTQKLHLCSLDTFTIIFRQSLYLTTI